MMESKEVATRKDVDQVMVPVMSESDISFFLWRKSAFHNVNYS